MAFKIFLSWLSNLTRREKLLRGDRAILSYLDLKFPKIQSRKGNFFFIPHSKVIGLTNYKLRISN